MSRDPIRLVASDLDGTLMGRDLVIPSATLETIAALGAAGVGFTLATGRTFPSALPYARRLGITLPLICFQGALVKDPGTGEVLLHERVPIPLAAEMLQAARERGLHVNLHIGDRVFVERDRPEAELYARISSLILEPVGDLVRFLEEGGEGPTKLVIISQDVPFLDRVWAELQVRFDGRLNLQKSLPEFMEVVSIEASKGKALLALAHRLGVARHHILALGDSYNDVSMLEAAGVGVAMGNAPPAVQAAADYVAPPLAEQGVVEALRRFVFDA